MRSTPKCGIISKHVRESDFMKTKIIYISGNEIFDVADIRAAFEEVRNALGFGMDTVLFGVPVDADDAGIQLKETPKTEVIVNESEQIITITEEIIEEELPKKKTPRKSKIENEPEEVVKSEAAEVEQPIEKNITEEKIIPILSVLSSKKEPEIQIEEKSEIPEVPEYQPVEEPQIIIHETDIISQVAEDMITTETVIMEEIMVDDIPVAQQHKTLEQLFERIAPLREDLNTEEFIAVEQPTEELNLDVTLEKLATEFAEKQDNINVNSKIETSGKIGKLKNILPFKKAKREEPSLMGDLFGWAGIAANDEEFSIPGFFTTSASKK